MKLGDATQPALMDAPRERKRRVELATDEAIRSARRAGQLDDVDAGAYTLARELARAVDRAAAKSDVWAITGASRELREVLTMLRLTPSTRDVGPSDELASALAELARPTVDL
jgi:cytosine/adenosine deaminase-related metal-dependent hydrolase